MGERTARALLVGLVGAIVIAAGEVPEARSQEEAFKGKTVELLIGLSAGGG